MDNSVRAFYQPHKYEHIEHGFGKEAPHNSGRLAAGYCRRTDKRRVNHAGQHNDRTL